MTDFNLKYVQTIWFDGQAMIYSKEQGKEYLHEVTFTAELDSSNRLTITEVKKRGE